MSAQDKIGAALAQYGRVMTLKRLTAPGVYAAVTVYGVTKGYKPQELVGSVIQGDRSVTISNAEIQAAGWPGPPRAKDLLVIDGTTTAVQGVETKYLGQTILAHVLWVRG